MRLLLIVFSVMSHLCNHLFTIVNLLKPTVTLLTTRFNIKKFHMVITLHLCFVWLSEQTATFALYIINRLVFITEVENIYCTERTESLRNTDMSRS